MGVFWVMRVHTCRFGTRLTDVALDIAQGSGPCCCRLSMCLFVCVSACLCP